MLTWGSALQLPTERGGAGEGDHRDAVVLEQDVDDLAGVTRHEIEVAWGESGVVKSLKRADRQ